MVTKIALLGMFSKSVSSFGDDVSRGTTRNKSSGDARITRSSSVSSTASFDCLMCSEYEKCGGNPNTDQLRGEMLKTLAW